MFVDTWIHGFQIICNITTVNDYVVRIWNLWIALPTKYMKVMISQYSQHIHEHPRAAGVWWRCAAGAAWPRSPRAASWAPHSSPPRAWSTHALGAPTHSPACSGHWCCRWNNTTVGNYQWIKHYSHLIFTAGNYCYKSCRVEIMQERKLLFISFPLLFRSLML